MDDESDTYTVVQVPNPWAEHLKPLIGSLERSPEEKNLASFWSMWVNNSLSYVVGQLQKGEGFGDDGGGVQLPEEIVCDKYGYKETIEKTDYVLVYFSSFSEKPDDECLVDLEMFLFYTNLALIYNAANVDPDLDPWRVMPRIRHACSNEFQKNMLRPEIRPHWIDY